MPERNRYEFLEVCQAMLHDNEYEHELTHLLRGERVDSSSDEGRSDIALTRLAKQFPEAVPLIEDGWIGARYSAQVVSYGQAALRHFVWGWQSRDYYSDTLDSEAVEKSIKMADETGSAHVGFTSGLVVYTPAAKSVVRFALVDNDNMPYVYAAHNRDESTVVAVTKRFHEYLTGFIVSPVWRDRQLDGVESVTIHAEKAIESSDWEHIKELHDALDSRSVELLRSHHVD